MINRLMNRLAVFFCLTLSSFSAVAEEAAHEAASGAEAAHGAGHAETAGHAAGIPMSVTYQVINFVIYIALLVYFLRNPIRNFFKNREQLYKQALVKGESARRDAEKKKRDIQQQLRALEASSDDSLDNARAEATALKLQIQQEGEELSARLREEAERSTTIEIARAKTQLREEMLTQSVALARKLLEDKIAEPDQKRLQSEFVGKIDEVR
jgi:F-type H+-transporting ATPase subunit b